MLRLIGSSEKELWDGIIQSFLTWDIYYLCDYARSLEEHEKGRALLIDFSLGEERLCYSVIEKDVADSPEFRNHLSKGIWFDWETPYGYGGPLSNKEKLSLKARQVFLKELTELCQQRQIVSQFIRFHPLLGNQVVLDNSITHKTFKDTIFMNLSSEKEIFSELDSKTRNMVRKAQKAGITIFTDQGEHLAEFLELYQESMDRAQAAPYYYFEKSYYEYLRDKLGEETVFFYAQMDGKIIAAAIFLYNNHFMHYHLSGNKSAFRRFAPTNLLLYEAACWGAKHGIRQLHLGGGNSNGDGDSLFAFKKGFNRNGRVPFYIGKTIFIPEGYQELLEIRQKANINFNTDNAYFIQYRKPEE